jgi:hypothetical protein
LEQIKEICAGGVDFDKILIGSAGGGREVGDFQVKGSLSQGGQTAALEGVRP